jgi:hypothetical protein
MVTGLRVGSAAALCRIVGLGVARDERRLGWTIGRKTATSATARLAYVSATAPDSKMRFERFDAHGDLNVLSDRIDSVTSGGACPGPTRRPPPRWSPATSSSPSRTAPARQGGRTGMRRSACRPPRTAPRAGGVSPCPRRANSDNLHLRNV